MPWLWLALRKLRSNWLGSDAAIRDVVAIGRPAVPKLVEILEERTDVNPGWSMENARLRAINAIEKISDPRAVPALIRALGDIDLEIAHSAAVALRHFDTPQAIAAVTRLDQQREQGGQKQIYFVHNIRPKYGRWRLDVIRVSPYRASAPFRKHWSLWVLGPEPRELTLDEDITVYEEDCVSVFYAHPPPPEKIYKTAVISTWRIERVPPDLKVGCFLAVVPKGVLCAFQVEVRLHFTDWDHFPNSSSSAARFLMEGFLRLGPPDEFEEQKKNRYWHTDAPPIPGQDMPVSVQFDEHSYLGVLRLQERIEGEPDSNEPKFRAELHFTETVPDLLPGKPLIRTVIWHEWLSDRSVTRDVATILSASRLS